MVLLDTSILFQSNDQTYVDQAISLTGADVVSLPHGL